MICFRYYLSKKEHKKSNEDLLNDIQFEGVIVKIKKSSNHAFGIIGLKITKTNVREFNDIAQKGIFPYKLRGDIAEVYCTISVERKLNDTVKVISNNQTIYYNPLFSKEEGSLSVITDFFNINFVKENSIFK